MATWKIDKSTLKELAEAASQLTEDMRIANTPEGWDIKVVDPAHVAMAEITVAKGRFSEFSEGEDEFVIPISKLKAFLNVAEEDVTIEVGDRIVLRSGTLSRSFAPIELNQDSPKVPNLNPSNSVNLDTTRILMAINSVDFVDYVKITINSDGTTVMASGDLDTVEIQFPEAKTDTEANAMYPLDYFRQALKSIPRNVEFLMDDDYPLVIRSSSLTDIMYLIAPRIESE